MKFKTCIITLFSLLAGVLNVPAATAAAVPQRHLAVVRVTWAGATISAVNESRIIPSLDNLISWWSTTSSGKETLSYRILPDVTIGVPANCDELMYMSKAAVTAQVAAAKLTSWATNLMAISANDGECFAGGFGDMPGTSTWIFHVSTEVMAHELGHNLGLGHASTCNGTRSVSLVDTCQKIEYGDLTDQMGAGLVGAPFNVFSLRSIGWLSDEQVAVWNGASTAYSLAPSTDQTGSIKAIKIDGTSPLLTDAPGEFWLEYRQVPSYPTYNGVYMTLVPTDRQVEKSTQVDTQSSTTSWAIDPSLGIPHNWRAFVPNVPWHDPTGKFTVTVTEVGQSARVTVTPGTVPPTAPVNVTTDVVKDSAGVLTGELTVKWDLVGSSAGFTEPLRVDVSIANSTSTCSASVFERSCTLHGLPRNRELLVNAVSVNNAGKSTVSTAVSGPIPVSAPNARLVLSSKGQSLSAIVEDFDDGGLADAVVGEIVLSTGKSCAARVLECSFGHRLAGAHYEASVTLSNGMGRRTIDAKIAIPQTKMKSPRIMVKKSASGRTVVTVTTAEGERYNVDRAVIDCGTKFRKTLRMRKGSASLSLPASVRQCRLYATFFNSVSIAYAGTQI